MNKTFSPIIWERLLKRIADKNVIPILGNEMYKIKDGESEENLDDFVLKKVIEYFGIEDANITSLPHAIAYIKKQKLAELSDIIDKLQSILNDVHTEFPLIDKLLGISQIYFYANTTIYTSILEKRIKKSRLQDAEYRSFSLQQSIKDCDFSVLENPVVFDVFGSVFNKLPPALTEEEMLEYTSSFHEVMKNNAPLILEAFKNSALLFIGCGHPEWLMRFFMRVISNNRMIDWERRPNNIFIVNDVTEKRAVQFDFLSYYNGITYGGNTAEFVNELSEKWQKYPDKKISRSIFLSYTHADIGATQILFDALTENLPKEVTIWFDKENLHSGDDFEVNITESIKKADVFIAVVSGNSLADPDKYVQKEWERAHAFNTAKGPEKMKKYLMPVMIDNPDLSNKQVKYYFNNLSIEPIPGGVPSEAFITRLKQNLNIL